MTPEILFEDKYLVVAVKPVGYLSEPGPGKNFPALLEEYLGKPVFTVHRLDKIVGGVMVFAKDAKTAGKLANLVAQRDISKEYLAIVRGVPREEEATLEDLLFRDASKNKTYVVKRMRRGVRDASLHYWLMGTAEHEGQKLSLVRIQLHTGRTHQIRVQFASRQLPLLGDIRYGSRDRNCEASLWSWRLGFEHPVTGETVDCKRLPDMQYPWELFASQIGAM